MKKESVIIQTEMAATDKTQVERYSDLIVGRRGFWPLIKHELIVMLCATMPGALGLWLRSQLYPLLLKRCGRKAYFGMNVTLRHPHKIEIGDGAIIDDNCLLDAKGRDNRGIVIGNDVFLGRNSILSCKNGDITLGDRVNLGFNCEVFSGSHVTVGANTLVAAYCYFIGGGHDSEQLDVAILQQGSSSYGIEIGEGCWFGAGVKVLDRVKIGARAILGAGAVVNKDIPEYAVAVGLPAKVIQDRRESKPAGG